MWKRKKKEKEKFVDDGRTVANMNVEGMPWYLSDAEKKHRAEGEVDLNKSERRAMMRGVILAVLLIVAVFGVAYLLLILFCVKVWFV